MGQVIKMDSYYKEVIKKQAVAIDILLEGLKLCKTVYEEIDKLRPHQLKHVNMVLEEAIHKIDRLLEKEKKDG